MTKLSKPGSALNGAALCLFVVTVVFGLSMLASAQTGAHVVAASAVAMNAGTVNRELLEQIGRDAIGDRLLFNDVDVDQLQGMLERKKKPEVVEESHADNLSRP